MIVKDRCFFELKRFMFQNLRPPGVYHRLPHLRTLKQGRALSADNHTTHMDDTPVSWLPSEEDRKEMILLGMEGLQQDSAELALRTREMHSSVWRLFRTPKTNQ